MKERMDRTWRWLAVNMGKHAGIVSVVGLAITIIMGFGLTKLDFATDQDAYLNKDEQVPTPTSPPTSRPSRSSRTASSIRTCSVARRCWLRSVWTRA